MLKSKTAFWMLPALTSFVVLSLGAVSLEVERLRPITPGLQAQQDPFAPEYNPPQPNPPQPLDSTPDTNGLAASSLSNAEILAQSWAAYKQRFIQADGRVIDREQQDRTVSEGQAYAMLRAVLIDDRPTFDLTLNWAEANLQRRPATQNPNLQNPTRPVADTLWAWKWGRSDSQPGQPPDWGVLDANFASDADMDAVVALILASRRWNNPAYLQLAQAKLKDLWELSTVTTSGRRPKRYFLPGPAAAFQPQPNQIYLNPSYLAPYAFRLFAQVDPTRDWESLVTSSYEVLQDSPQLSEVGLPSDWVMLDLDTGRYSAPPAAVRLRSTYSFDAFRVWWRVALDAAWFRERQAKTFLTEHLPYVQTLWQQNQKIPARINLRGYATARYEATSQYAMLYPALLLVDQDMATEVRQKL
ncbi:MAG: glycosyl hydrolase family 8, partial [Elainella sp.]